MSKEEVAEIITYCREHNVRQCERLKELGIASWRFYDEEGKECLHKSDCPTRLMFLISLFCVRNN